MALQTTTAHKYPNTHIQAAINMQLEEENRNLRLELKVVKAALQRYQQQKHIDFDEKLVENNEKKFVWDEIDHCLRTHNINRIKDVITKTDINLNQTDSRHKNMTLLMKACVFGNYDIAELLVHSQADIDVESEEKMQAIDYAHQWANSHIVQLLQCEDFATALGSQVQHKIDTLHRQNGITHSALGKLDTHALDGIVGLMMHCVENRLPFSDEMMHIAWTYLKQQKQRNCVDSPLFQLMLATYSKIVKDTSNLRDWSWLHNYLLPSTVWLNPYKHDHSRTLFNELFIGAETANDKLSLQILLPSIRKLKTEHKGLWSDLKKFKIENCENPIGANQVSTIRQDEIENGIKAKYGKTELLRNKPRHSHFNPVSHYDLNEYLNKLFFRGTIVDDVFQTEIQSIIKQIVSGDGSICVRYKRGPIKLIQRCIAKVEHKYTNEGFPTSAHLLDINRCSLTFADLPSMMRGTQRLIELIHSQKTCLKRIVRCKNGWNSTDFTDAKPKYSDIKLNVVIDTGNGSAIIGEIQILLALMEQFKLSSHKYYAIFRMQRFISENYVDVAPVLLDIKTQLFNYACNGDRKSLLRLIVNYSISAEQLLIPHSKSGKTILSKICDFNHIKGLKLLQCLCTNTQFESALVLCDRTSEQWNPIGEALNANSTDIIQFLCREYPQLMLEFGHLNQGKMRGKHSLHFACQNGNISYLEWYLNEIKHETFEEKKALLSIKDMNGYIPLVIACNYAQTEIIQYLMGWAANEHMQTAMVTMKDNRGWNTPLMLCCFKGNASVVKCLLQSVTNPELRLAMILDCDQNGFTPLIYAALSESKQSAQCAQILVTHIKDAKQRLEYIKHESNDCYEHKTAEQHSSNEMFKAKILELLESALN